MSNSIYFFKCSIILGLTILFGCSSKIENKSIKEDTTKINSDSIVQKTDTIIGYIVKYDFDRNNNKRHGVFESFYFENGKILSKACKANYENGILKGKMEFYDENGKIITKYEDIKYDAKSKTYSAKIFVYDKNYKIKEEGFVTTTDELDFSPIFDDASCCFDKINLSEWKYY